MIGVARSKQCKIQGKYHRIQLNRGQIISKNFKRRFFYETDYCKKQHLCYFVFSNYYKYKYIYFLLIGFLPLFCIYFLNYTLIRFYFMTFYFIDWLIYCKVFVDYFYFLGMKDIFFLNWVRGIEFKIQYN